MRGANDIDMIVEDNVIDNLDTYQSVFRGEMGGNYYFRNNTFINVNARVALFHISYSNVFVLNDTFIHSANNGLSSIIQFGLHFIKSDIQINGLHIYNNSFSSPSFVVLAALSHNKALSFTDVYIYDNSKFLVLLNHHECIGFTSVQPLFVVVDTESFNTRNIVSKNNSYSDSSTELKSIFQILKI